MDASSARRASGGSALELWTVLFMRHRASRQGGTDEEDRKKPDNDALCEAIRARLAAADVAERGAVLAVLAVLAAGLAFGRG